MRDDLGQVGFVGPDETVPGCEELRAVVRRGVSEAEECRVCGDDGVVGVGCRAGWDEGPGEGGAGVCLFVVSWILGRSGGRNGVTDDFKVLVALGFDPGVVDEGVEVKDGGVGELYI